MRLGRVGLISSEKSSFKIGNLSFMAVDPTNASLSFQTAPDSTPPSSPLDAPPMMTRISEIEKGYGADEDWTNSIKTSGSNPRMVEK